MKKVVLLLFLFVTGQSIVFSQTIYVNGIKGRDGAKGTSDDPFPTLDKAVMAARTLSGKDPITLK